MKPAFIIAHFKTTAVFCPINEPNTQSISRPITCLVHVKSTCNEIVTTLVHPSRVVLTRDCKTK